MLQTLLQSKVTSLKRRAGAYTDCSPAFRVYITAVLSPEAAVLSGQNAPTVVL